jgi:nicotinate-nucleotide pyrophosphorylase (carboxylating)
MINEIFYKNFDFKQAKKIIKDALKEDAGKGDVTSNALIPSGSVSKANIVFKDNGIIAGLGIFELIFKIIDKKLKINFSVSDGDYLKFGTIIGNISGKTRSILLGERLALNIIQRLSGIATAVNNYTRRLNNKTIKILDTRKTTPNFRIFEKLAVKIGGGENHRFGLYDMMLIKDNHISANGGIIKTLEKLKTIKIKSGLKVEIEVKNLFELNKVVKFGNGIVDIVMLDNFRIRDIAKAIIMVDKKFKIEVSGGVKYDILHLYSGLKGIDFISVGAVTHSVKSTDISLDFVP